MTSTNQTATAKNATAKNATKEETVMSEERNYVNDTIYIDTSTKAQLTVDHIAEIQDAILNYGLIDAEAVKGADFELDKSDAKEVISSMLSRDTASRRTLRTLQRTLIGLGYELKIGTQTLNVTAVRLYRPKTGGTKPEYVETSIDVQYIELNESADSVHNVWDTALSNDVLNNLRHEFDMLRDALSAANATEREQSFVDSIERKLFAGPNVKETEGQRLYVVSVPSYNVKKNEFTANTTVIGMFFPSKIESQFSYTDPNATAKAKAKANAEAAELETIVDAALS